MIDPRASLVDRLGASDALRDLLRRMDSTEILVHSSPDAAALTLSVVNLCSRLFPNISVISEHVVDVPSFGQGRLDDIALRVVEGARVSSPRKPTGSISIGVGVHQPGLDLYCSSGVWNLRLSREPHDCLTEAGPATAAASALASAQLTRDLLPELGGVRLKGLFDWNLLDYSLTVMEKEPPPSLVDFVLFGAGSVGSSIIYALLLGEARGSVVAVDPDRLTPRNRLRYPVQFEAQAQEKVFWLKRLSAMSNLTIIPVLDSAANFVSKLDTSPKLVVSSVDNVTARRDVVDALAEVTLDCGVDALQFHVSRHRFGDGWACGYCEYVDSGEILDQAEIYSRMTGLPENKVSALLSGKVLDEEDLELMRLSKRVEGPLDEFAGARLQDLVRARLYAQARSLVGDSVVAVSAPYVSALAGAILASEVQKTSPELVDFAVNRRIDVDCSGYPTGIVSRPRQDSSGRCLCSDRFRLDEYRATWPSTQTASTYRP